MQRRNAVPYRRLPILVRTSAAVLLLASVMSTPGCIITAATVGIIYFIRSAGEETAIAEVDASPREIYEAALRVVDADPNIVLKNKDDERMTISVSRGKETASGSVKLLANGNTELTVKAKSPKGREESARLARGAAKRVCEELGAPYLLVK